MRSRFRLTLLSILCFGLSLGFAAPAMAAQCYISQAEWDTWHGEIECTSPDARCCDGNDCPSYGFTYNGWETDPCQYCVNPWCTDPSPLAVPELHEYAAALFLCLALYIGWRTRRNTATPA